MAMINFKAYIAEDATASLKKKAEKLINTVGQRPFSQARMRIIEAVAKRAADYAGMLKRVGLNEDTGDAARELYARQDEFSELTITGIVDGVDDKKINIVEANLGDAAVAYQFIDKNSGKAYIVKNTNTTF